MVVELENPVIRGFVRRLGLALDALHVEERGRPEQITYDANDKVVWSHTYPLQELVDVAPETLGEQMVSAACR